MSDNPKYRDEEWLRENYVKHEKTTREMAEECGCSHRTICRHLRNNNIEIRNTNTPADDRLADGDWVREQYLEKDRTTTEISDICDCHHGTVSDWLNKHGIEKERTDKPADQRLTDKEWLRNQYSTLGRSATEIAEQLGCSRSAVSRWLNKKNIPIRSGAGEKPADKRLTDPDWLRQEYLEKKQSSYEIAESNDFSPTTVRAWLSRHNIETRGKNARLPDRRLKNSDWVREQYLEQEKSTREISDLCGCSRKTVTFWLNEHEIEGRHTTPTGNDHPSWNGGPKPYGNGWNGAKRRTVRRRDNHTCQDPRCTVTQADHLDEYGEKLHVHHLRKARDVDDAAERNAKENLITLCRGCHRRWEKIADAGLVPQISPEPAD